jgi:radical SAM protein with 4Fe4S-binding SPASM domain
VTLRPANPNFAKGIPALRNAGLNWIRIDLPGAYAANPKLDADAMADALNEVSRTYAEALAANKYYRLDPIAELFNHIYEGKPNHRTDPAGAGTLFIDQDGAIYPHADFRGAAEFKLGTLTEGAFDESRREIFYDLGAQNIGVCRACWARGLCGGGAAAVHHARTGTIHTPDPAWCDAQRRWLAALVASFNVLSSKGVDFTRVYQSLTNTGRPSVFKMLRAAFQQTVGMRPIEEADGEMLTAWEEWNDAAYFSFTETSVLMTTQYDREMDALHPQGQQQELMLIHRDGTPFGLFRVRPERVKGAAEVAMYFRNDADYANDGVRKGMQTLLKQAGGQQELRRLTAYVGSAETGLQQFLEALGFQREGTLREALYLHDAYHDVHVYGITL